MDKLSLVFALLLMGSGPAMAGTGSQLHAPKPQENTAFVRFISHYDRSKFQHVIINEKEYEDLHYKKVSPYFTMPAGKLAAEIGPAKDSFNVETGRYYTVVLTEHGTMNVAGSHRTFIVSNNETGLIKASSTTR